MGQACALWLSGSSPQRVQVPRRPCNTLRGDNLITKGSILFRLVESLQQSHEERRSVPLFRYKAIRADASNQLLLSAEHPAHGPNGSFVYSSNKLLPDGSNQHPTLLFARLLASLGGNPVDSQHEATGRYETM